MGLRMESFKLWLRTVVDDGGTLRRSGTGFTSVAVPGTAEANTFTAAQTIAPTAATSGARTALTVTGAADTGITASTEQSDIYYNGSRTVTFATGALANLRMVRLRPPTVAFAGASTLTNFATVYVEGAASLGSNATITNNYAVWVDAGRVRLDGPLVLNDVPVVQHTSDLTVGPTITTPAMTVRVPSGSTSVTVTHAAVAATTCFRVSPPLGATSNAIYVRSCVPGSGSFVLTLSGDPGASHADFYVELVQPGAGT
jgi:hypothetical protein